jgi:hypothetical protein
MFRFLLLSSHSPTPNFSDFYSGKRPEAAIPAWFINILRLRLRLIPSITQFIAYAYITDSILLGGGKEPKLCEENCL